MYTCVLAFGAFAPLPSAIICLDHVVVLLALACLPFVLCVCVCGVCLCVRVVCLGLCASVPVCVFVPVCAYACGCGCVCMSVLECGHGDGGGGGDAFGLLASRLHDDDTLYVVTRCSPESIFAIRRLSGWKVAIYIPLAGKIGRCA